jgi:hypothetical protein
MRNFLFLAPLLFLTGCFQTEVYHKLENHGNSDHGGYRISMAPSVYMMLVSDDGFSEAMNSLRRFSNPQVSTKGGVTSIEDISGNASMEHFYDQVECVKDPRSFRHAKCTYRWTLTDADYYGWSVNWVVALERDMTVLSGNYNRTRQENGAKQLIWLFDGNHTSSAKVEFTVRVKRA